MSKLFAVVCLLGVPLIILYALRYDLVPELAIDTSEDAARKIRPGMTVAEAEQIMGAPPGDYHAPGRAVVRSVGGHTWPNLTTWSTYRGRIDVADGASSIHEFGTSSTSDGIVDRVTWAPNPATPAQIVAALLRIGVACFALPCIVYLKWWSLRRPSSPAPPTGS